MALPESLNPARPRVFCASLADWLDDEVPIEWLTDLLTLIAATPNLDWLLLTKRPENWRDRLGEAAFHTRTTGGDMSIYCAWGNKRPPENVWVGTSVENQAAADLRIPQLLEIPAKVRFLSCEPLLEQVDLILDDASGWSCPECESRNINPQIYTEDWSEWECFDCGSCGSGEADWTSLIHWVIVGGESGPGARPFTPDWARSIRNDCSSSKIAFFMKQMGGIRKPFPEIPDDLMIREFPKGGQS